MNSCIYEGWVRHRRFKPVEHVFRYRIFMMMLDLDELDEVFAASRLWSTRRRAIARFRRDDHLGDSSEPLQKSVLDFVEEESGERPEGPIRLLTNLRYFGYVFNPVSFFYCYDRTGEQLISIVAEVHNTPWNQRHCYLLPVESQQDVEPNAGSAVKDTQKSFHVSPFMPMDVRYAWKVTSPDENLLVHIENRKADDLPDARPFFDVTMNMNRREINRKNLSRLLWRYPAMTARVTAAIYGQALRLWLKKAPFYSHPDKLQTVMDAQ